jgi:hypothetical protein
VIHSIDKTIYMTYVISAKKQLCCLVVSLFLIHSQQGKAQTLQSVTDNGNTTTKNVWIAAQPGGGVMEGALNVGGRFRLLGGINSYAMGTEGDQPTMYRTGVSTLGYPFNGYNHLVIQGGTTNNRDILFVTGSTPAERMVIKGTGNIGIGTLNPIAKLDIFTNTSVFGLKIGDEASSNIRIAGTAGGPTGYGSIQTYSAGVIGGVLALQRDGGNVGIGVSNPKERLAVKGDMSMYADLRSIDPRPAVAGGSVPGEIRGLGGGNSTSSSSSNWDDGFLRLSAGGGSNPTTKSFIDLSGYISPDASGDTLVMERFQNITMGTSGQERLRIASNGSVGIGTKKMGVHKLAVNGSIGARMLVITQETWADFVFHPSYQLPSLQEVAAFINANQHLPGIPSEAQVIKDGLNVGEMNKQLLQKIEELTLYMIQQDKRMEEQEKEIATLKKRLM